MIFKDFEALGTERLPSRLREGIINKYKTEAVYYAVIAAVLKRYGIAPPPPEPGDKTDPGMDGRDIANMDVNALGAARDQMAMRLSDMSTRTGGARGVSYATDEGTGIRIVTRGGGRDGALTAGQLRNIAADALRESEPLYQAIQTHIASEARRDAAMSDEELAAATDAEIDRLLDEGNPGGIMGEINAMISEMSSNGGNYGYYSMTGRTKRNVANERIYESAVRDVPGSAVNPELYARIAEFAKKGGAGLVTLGSDRQGRIIGQKANYAEFPSPEKEPGYSGSAMMLKISPLMPEMQPLREAGAFENTLGRNGFLMFDAHRNMLVPAPVNESAYDAYASMSDERLAVDIDGDAPIVLGLSEATETRYVRHTQTVARDDDDVNGDREIHYINVSAGSAMSGVLLRKRYDSANTAFKARMIEILEAHSSRGLNKNDIEAIDRIFDGSGREPTIFGSDWDEIEKNSEAYFEYIDYVCRQAKERISSHEFEIHFSDRGGRNFAPVMYMTGERTDDYITAKSSTARFIAVYPYARYDSRDISGENRGKRNALAAMGDIELPSRDGYRIVNVVAHDAVPKGAPYFEGTVTAGMVSEMRKAFDTYVVGSARSRGNIELRKVSRPDRPDAAFDASSFLSGDGSVIQHASIISKLADDMNATKNAQSAMFRNDDNIKKFQAAIDELASSGHYPDAASALLAMADGVEDAGTLVARITSAMSVCALHAVRDSLGEDRNNFTVQRHIFMKYAADYASKCAGIITDGSIGEDERREALNALNPIADDPEFRILSDGLDEIFGYEYGDGDDKKYVIKANTCKYMSLTMASYDDYDKLLALLSHTDQAEYEPNKLADVSGPGSEGRARATIQLYSSEAYDDGLAGEPDDDGDNANDDVPGAGNDYNATFDDDVWYASTFARTSDGDISYASLNGGDEEAIIFKATHPLQAAALERTAEIIRSNTGRVDSEGLRVTPQGVVYYRPTDGDGQAEFKIGPVLDEKAYIRPIVTRLTEEEAEGMPGARILELPKLGADGNFIYDSDGLIETERVWASVDYNIRISGDGRLLNPVAFGALDTERLIGGNGAMNRFYGISAKVGGYDGYGHDGKRYGERMSFGTYQAGVLENIGRQLSEYYIARRTIEDDSDGASNERHAHAAAYCEIGGGTLMKCYRTNTYILGDKIACKFADKYMSNYRSAMAEVTEGIPGGMAGLGPEHTARKFYEAAMGADMDALDEICARARAEGMSAFGEYAEDIERRIGAIDALYAPIGNGADDPLVRRKYRENANLANAQAAMNRNRVVMPKITLDQNIGLKETANNIQQDLKGMLPGTVDRKSLRDTDSLSPRVAVSEQNNLFDPELTATAKQYGAVAYMQGNVAIDRLTGRVATKSGLARSVLVSEGVRDFATGSPDIRFVRYVGGKAMDRMQLSLNAIEKALGYAQGKMAMVSAWYDMEDGYIISKRAARELGHFEADGTFMRAKEYDKIGDSESGNKGIISKVVDTDIESEDELKRKLVPEYIQDRRVNGKPIVDGGADEHLEGLLRRYDNRFDEYGNIDEAWDRRRLADAAGIGGGMSDALYAAAYDYMQTQCMGLDRGIGFLFNMECQIANYPASNAAKAAFMSDFIEGHMRDDSVKPGEKEELAKMLDESLMAFTSVYPQFAGAADNFNDMLAATGEKYRDAVAEIESEDERLPIEIADYMASKNMQPWTGHYGQESWLWRLFRDNDDLDVAVTDACVNTRSNPSLLMYIADDAENTLTIDGVEYENAKGLIAIYLDSHRGDDKNVDYTSASNKRGRGVGAQEKYMMDAKGAGDKLMLWLKLNDRSMPKNIAQYNRKLMMNGFVMDIGDNLQYALFNDVLNGAELKDISKKAGKLAYKADNLPGTPFIDMDVLAGGIASKVAEYVDRHGASAALARAITAMAEDGNFAPMLDIADGRLKKERNDGTVEKARKSREAEDRIRNMFADAFGSIGGGVMLLPEGISDYGAYAYHEDRKSKRRDYEEDDMIPLSVNGDPDYDDGFGAYEYDRYYDNYRDVHAGKFSVPLYADVTANGEARRAMPLLMSSYESINDETETVTAKTDDRLQLDIFKSALGCALIDAIEGKLDEEDKTVRAACDEARGKLASRMVAKYEKASDGSSKTLNLISRLPHYFKKTLCRATFSKSLTCVWHGNPNIEIDEAGLSFESAKKLGYLRPLPLSPEQRAKIPDDYAHMHLRYEPVGSDDLVWVNRSPGQTTGCARMFRLRITGQSGGGLQIHPAVATIFDGDFDGDTVGVANPLYVDREAPLAAYLDKNPGFRQEVLDEIKSSMTMSANLLKTADYEEISVNGKAVRTFPLFIAGNADVAIARANMEAEGIDIGSELERITLLANIAEQAKQSLRDGNGGKAGRQIEPADAEAMRKDRMSLISAYAEYAKGKDGSEWREISEKAAEMAACLGGGNKDAAREKIREIETACAGRLRKAYSDMEGYVSKGPCFTRGGSALDMGYNKIADANVNKKGKPRQLNALFMYGGMHTSCAEKYAGEHPDRTEPVYGVEVVQGDDKKYRLKATEIGVNGEKRDLGILDRDGGGFAIRGDGIGEAEGREMAAKINEQLRWDRSRSVSDVPLSRFMTENELNSAAQACKSDATGLGGAVAQKFQMLMAPYGYGEIALRISGPITQKFLDAKQNPTMVRKNLKIGKTALDAVCKLTYVREFSGGYNNPGDGGRKPVPEQVYNGHFTRDPKRQITIGGAIEQIDNLLAAIGQPRLSEIEKKAVGACAHAYQRDYARYAGKEFKNSGTPGHETEKIETPTKTAYAALCCHDYDAMYNTGDGMMPRKIMDRIEAIKNGKPMFDDNITGVSLRDAGARAALEGRLSDMSKAVRMAEGCMARLEREISAPYAGTGTDATSNATAGKTAAEKDAEYSKNKRPADFVAASDKLRGKSQAQDETMTVDSIFPD